MGQRIETKRVKIGYTAITSAPNKRKIRKTIDQYANDGWNFAGREESEGILGFGAHTMLTFQRPSG